MSIISPQEISLPLKKKNNYSIFIFWHTKIASYLLKLIKCWSDGGIFSCFLITRSFNLNVFLLWSNVSILEYGYLDLQVSSISCSRNPNTYLYFCFLVIILPVEPQPLLLLVTSGNLFFFGTTVQNIRKVICALAATYINHVNYAPFSKSPTGCSVWRIFHNIHPAFRSPLLLLYFFYYI